MLRRSQGSAPAPQPLQPLQRSDNPPLLADIHLSNLSDHVQKRKELISQLSEEVKLLEHDAAQLAVILGFSAIEMHRLEIIDPATSEDKCLTVELYFAPGEESFVAAIQQKFSDMGTIPPELNANQDGSGSLPIKFKHPLFQRPIAVGESLYLSAADCISVWQQKAIVQYNDEEGIKYARELKEKSHQTALEPISLKLSSTQKKRYDDVVDHHGDPQTIGHKLLDKLTERASMVFSALNKKSQELRQHSELLLINKPAEFPAELWEGVLPYLYLPPLSPEENWQAFVLRLPKSLIQCTEGEINGVMKQLGEDLNNYPKETTSPERLNRTLGDPQQIADDVSDAITTELFARIGTIIESIKQQLPVRQWPETGPIQIQSLAKEQMALFVQQVEELKKAEPSEQRSRFSTQLDTLANGINYYTELKLADKIPFKSKTLNELQKILMLVWQSVQPDDVLDNAQSGGLLLQESLKKFIDNISQNNMPMGRNKYNQLPTWKKIWELIETMKVIVADKMTSYKDKKERLRNLLSQTKIAGIFAELIREVGLAQELLQLEAILDQTIDGYKKNTPIKKKLQDFKKFTVDLRQQFGKSLPPNQTEFASPSLNGIQELIQRLKELADEMNYRESIQDRLNNLFELLPMLATKASAFKEIRTELCTNLPTEIRIVDDQQIKQVIINHLSKIADAIGSYSHTIKSSEKQDNKMKKEEDIINSLIPFLSCLKDSDFRRGLRENPEGTLVELKYLAHGIDPKTEELFDSHKGKKLEAAIDEAIKKFSQARAKQSSPEDLPAAADKRQSMASMNMN